MKATQRIAIFRNQLLRIGEQESLSKLVLFVIIAVDIYILSVIFGGLSDHTRQLTTPEEYIPYQCHDIFIRGDWSEDARLDELQRLALADYNNYSYYYESILSKSNIERMHPSCRKFFEQIREIARNPTLKSLFLKRQTLQKQRTQIKSDFNKDKDIYDSSLLQNIAENSSESQLPNIRDKVKNDFSKIQDKDTELTRIEKEILSSPEMKELLKIIEPNSEIRDQLIKEYKRIQFWYPLKKILWQFLFLLPLMIIFYLWNTYSLKKNFPIQILFSSHLLAVSSIPVLIKILETVLDLIPKHFFKNLFVLLSDLHLVAIWHYLVIILTVSGALLLIYILQKKFFNQEKIYRKRLSKGLCFSCGLKLPLGTLSAACPFCGNKQMVPCKKCSEPTPVKGLFCIKCGEKI